MIVADELTIERTCAVTGMTCGHSCEAVITSVAEAVYEVAS